MKHNVAEVAALQPDYVGFIFYDKSPRDFEGFKISEDIKIKKVGVFVDAPIQFVIEKIQMYNLDVIQLHGDESPDYCSRLVEPFDKLKTGSIQVSRTEPVEVWKVFSIKDCFDFNVLTPYEHVVSKFLFDTKGKEKGGNGYRFDWSVLKEYPSQKSFILSGGIGLHTISEVEKLLKTELPIYALDVNSKFEDSPGLKNIKALKTLKKILK